MVGLIGALGALGALSACVDFRPARKQFHSRCLWSGLALRRFEVEGGVSASRIIETAVIVKKGLSKNMKCQCPGNHAPACRSSGSLTAYAFRTNPKHELTQLGAGLYSAGNALGMFCLMKLFFFRGHRASDLALSCLATLFFSLYLVYDTYRLTFPTPRVFPCVPRSCLVVVCVGRGLQRLN